MFTALVICLYCRRTLFEDKIQKKFPNAIYIPMTGEEILASNDSPLVQPVKTAFDKYLLTLQNKPSNPSVWTFLCGLFNSIKILAKFVRLQKDDKNTIWIIIKSRFLDNTLVDNINFIMFFLKNIQGLSRA